MSISNSFNGRCSFDSQVRGRFRANGCRPPARFSKDIDLSAGSKWRYFSVLCIYRRTLPEGVIPAPGEVEYLGRSREISELIATQIAALGSRVSLRANDQVTH